MAAGSLISILHELGIFAGEIVEYLVWRIIVQNISTCKATAHKDLYKASYYIVL